MGTKNRPTPNDCYAKALPDEPVFVLLARDPSAPELVRAWATERQREINAGNRPKSDREAVYEAVGCAAGMEAWRRQNDGVWRTPLPLPAMPEPGANPLDTPEAREAIFEWMMRVVEAWPEVPEDAEEEDAAKRQMTGAVVDALAPHVAAVQRAAWQACVEAVTTAAHAELLPEGPMPDDAVYNRGVHDVIGAIRLLPTPAEFAAPEAAP